MYNEHFKLESDVKVVDVNKTLNSLRKSNLRKYFIIIDYFLIFEFFQNLFWVVIFVRRWFFFWRFFSPAGPSIAAYCLRPGPAHSSTPKTMRLHETKFAIRKLIYKHARVRVLLRPKKPTKNKKKKNTLLYATIMHIRWAESKTRIFAEHWIIHSKPTDLSPRTSVDETSRSEIFRVSPVSQNFRLERDLWTVFSEALYLDGKKNINQIFRYLTGSTPRRRSGDFSI